MAKSTTFLRDFVAGLAGPSTFGVRPTYNQGLGDPVEQQTTFDVILETVGDEQNNVIKVVRAATNLGLKEAQAMVEAAPKTIKEGMPKADAEKLKKELEDQGATVKLK